ncbi:hypothetical protein DUI87_18836 [Hirundo rustica rustica]|uniref:RNase H type-1 domain-containing protein n=1 Tax=Hirundo rustica rustica TaxID=333673 RepID=A0A3M0JUT2_HIRRU|nr:hypothetical protein DUI87_18836 [Hirundo rustica rustica]
MVSTHARASSGTVGWKEDNFKIRDTVWYTGEVGKLNIQPISVEIQNPEIPIRAKQHPVSLDGQKGLKPVVENSVHHGVLESCVSPHNTPILPVKKPDGSYRLVQDLRADREGTRYTDSKYAFGVVHTFRKIWKERGFINTQRKGLVHQGLIIQILKALKSPKKIAVVHVKGHQRRRGIKTRRNNLADDEAKKASLRENSNVIMTFQEAGTQNQTPYFSLTEEEAMKNLGATLKEGQWILPDETTIRLAEKG